MAESSLLLQALQSFARNMGSSYDIANMSHDLCEKIASVLDADGAGVSVVDTHGRLKFVTATNEIIRQIEEVQDRTQEGPCVTAFSSLRPQAVGEISLSTEWPQYARRAAELDLRAVVGFPMIYDDRPIGAINVYSRVSREWTPDDLGVIAVFADMATAYLVRTSELIETREMAEQLQGALDSRVVIEQAKGILANQYEIGVDEAFEILRHHSRANQLKLTAVADAVVNMGLRLPSREE